MPQSLAQTQTQVQKQEQRLHLTPQQLLVARLTSLSLDELKERVEAECMENPWLETRPTARRGDAHRTAYSGAMERGETQSFYDRLTEQVGEYDLSDDERSILEYLIGSLDDNGYISKPLSQMADELEIYHSTPATEQDVERMLSVLQRFDPPGIGARSLRECLLLQHPSDRLREVLEHHWDEFVGKHWDRIQKKMQLSDAEVEHLRREVQRMNPRPGANMNEAAERQLQTIRPDFIVETDEDGVIHLALNQGDVPSVRVSDDVPSEETSGKDASFVHDYVEKGQMFVDALTQRRQTLLSTMKAIIRIQKDFFRSGDEGTLHPMRLEDVAEKTGYDISTVSRVTTSKYVETPYGTYPLKWFFSSTGSQDGEEVSVRKVKQALREIIMAEDKKKPMSDEQLCNALQQQGYDIARRTVAKYREAMGFPQARLRR